MLGSGHEGFGNSSPSWLAMALGKPPRAAECRLQSGRRLSERRLCYGLGPLCSMAGRSRENWA